MAHIRLMTSSLILLTLVIMFLITAALFDAVPLAFAGVGDEHHHAHADEHGTHGDHEVHDEYEKGPHGGRLLVDGDITVELALLEQGNSSVFRAWITQDGQSVNDNSLVLTTELTRLGGEVNHFKFLSNEGLWLSADSIKEPHSFDAKVTLSRAGKQHQWHFESYENRVNIAPEVASKAGIKSEVANTGQIKQTVTVYGKAVADPSRVSHIRANYSGIITNIRATIGDLVNAGDILAEIESNESLKRYTITSPLTGVVTAQNGNPGELAQDQVLLTVANYNQMWVEFRVFPSQVQHISVGQWVTVSAGPLQAESMIKHLLPEGSGQPFMIARVLLDNSNGQWTPGLMLEGAVVIKQTSVPLVIDNRALQSIQGQEVVFVQAGNSYEARPVELGLSDGTFTEVLTGLSAGDQYVVENSYLIKADIEKSGASHHH